MNKFLSCHRAHVVHDYFFVIVGIGIPDRLFNDFITDYGAAIVVEQKILNCIEQLNGLSCETD